MYLKKVSPKFTSIGLALAAPTNHGIHPLTVVPFGATAAISAPTGHPGKSASPFRLTPP